MTPKRTPTPKMKEAIELLEYALIAGPETNPDITRKKVKQAIKILENTTPASTDRLADKIGALIIYQEMTLSMEKSRGGHPYLVNRAEIMLSELKALEAEEATTTEERG